MTGRANGRWTRGIAAVAMAAACLIATAVSMRAKLDAATVLAAIGARDSSAAARLDRVRKSLQHIEDGLEVAEATPLRGDRRRRRMKAALFRAPSAISEDVSKFARETSAQQRRYNSVVAREEAQNEEYVEEEARYRKLRARAYLKQYDSFLGKRAARTGARGAGKIVRSLCSQNRRQNRLPLPSGRGSRHSFTFRHGQGPK